MANSNTATNTINDPVNGIKALSDKVDRTGLVLLNNGLLGLKAGFSDPATAKFVQQAKILADEVGKLLGSSQGSDFAIQLGQSMVNPFYSQSTFNATMDNLESRIQNKAQEYKAQMYQNPTKTTVQSNGQTYNVGQVYNDGTANWIVDAQGKWTKQ